MEQSAIQQNTSDARYILVARDNSGSRDIRIHDLSVRTPGINARTLVAAFSATVRPGDRIVFTGPSGSGKTLTAKSILGRHDAGSGLVVLPENARLMAMSQKTYFPNDTLRTIMNMAPEGQGRYTDDQIAASLRAVGHEKLVQHIPGQQVKTLMEGLLADIPALTAGMTAAEAREKLRPVIAERVAAQFDTVQYTPPQQRAWFAEKLAAQAPALAAQADDITDDIDAALAAPLSHRLTGMLPHLAESMRGHIFSYSPDKAALFIALMKWQFKKAVKKFLANEDTDDLSRPVYINRKQADLVIENVMSAMAAAFDRHTKRGVLSHVFNSVTWPVSPLFLRLKAARAAQELAQATTYFMDKQVLRGETLTLSGGEMQKLAIAIADLHQPDILILDEITAALDRETGEQLYKQLMTRIPEDTIVISIAHNEHIMKYHTHHARLENGQLTLRPLTPG